MANRLKILFLSANPVNGKSLLRLDQEFREIRNKLRAGRGGDGFDLVSEWAVTPEELQEVLQIHQPHILHFSGHGSKRQGIALEDEKGNMSLLDKRALANLLKALKDNLRMVVLNACYSKNQVKYLQDIVDFTIAMKKAIGDEAAIAFASHLYQALAFGRSVPTAFELGRSQLDLLNIGESDTPKLLVRYGVDLTKGLCEGIADLEAQSSDAVGETTGTRRDRYVTHQSIVNADNIIGVGFGERVIKDSPVRGRFSRRKIKAAVQAVARRHGTS